MVVNRIDPRRTTPRVAAAALLTIAHSLTYSISGHKKIALLIALLVKEAVNLESAFVVISTFMIPVIDVKLGGIEVPLYSADRAIESQELLAQDEIINVSLPSSVLKSEKVRIIICAPSGLTIQQLYSWLPALLVIVPLADVNINC
jgi:hypothetical protein